MAPGTADTHARDTREPWRQPRTGSDTSRGAGLPRVHCLVQAEKSPPPPEAFTVTPEIFKDASTRGK